VGPRGKGGYYEKLMEVNFDVYEVMLCEKKFMLYITDCFLKDTTFKDPENSTRKHILSA